MLLHKFDKPFVVATIVRRPSKCSYSPYLLDCLLDDGSEVVVHNAALGCCGLVAAGRRCYLQAAGSVKTLSSYVLYLVEDGDALVCVHPTIANSLAGAIIRSGELGRIDGLQPEFAISNCRFDYGGLKEGRVALFEVKSAPITTADTTHTRFAEFPIGERTKGKSKPISERAIKQLELLAELAAEGAACHVIYIIGRADTTTLKVGERDAFYRVASSAAGLKKYAFSVCWSVDGSCRLAASSIAETGEMLADSAANGSVIRLFARADTDSPDRP